MAGRKGRKVNNALQVYIKKSNRLNSALMYGDRNDASYPLACTYDGYRIWLIAAALYQKTANPVFRISFDEYAKLIGVERPRVETIRKSLSTIISSNFLIPDTESMSSYIIVNLFSNFNVNEKERCITGKLNQDYLEMLDKKMSGRFTMISLQSVNNCKRSLCTARLYELCKQNAYKGKLSYDNILLFHAAVGYDKQDFEIRILDKWVSIINSGTDISISYTVTRGEKNKIKSLEFTIAANNANLHTENNETGNEAGSIKENSSELLSFDKKMLLADIVDECLCREISLAPKDAEEIMETAYEVIPPKIVQNVTGESFDANRDKRTWRIISNIKYLAQKLQEGKKIARPKSWIKAAIQNDYANDPL